MRRRKPFDEFEEIFDQFMSNYIKEFQSHFEDWGEIEPYEYNFPLEKSAGKRRKIEVSEGKPRTLIDVFEIGDEIHVVADLNGTKEDEVELYLSDRELEIRTINELNLYEKIELPVKVDIKSMKQSFKNGVLEVTLKRKTT